MHANSNDRLAVTYAVLTVALWSTVATAFKLALRHVDVFQLLLISSLTATLCLYLILVFRGRRGTPWKQSRRTYLHALALGALIPFAYYLVLFGAYSLLPAQVAQALNYTWAIALMLLSVPLLQHRLTRSDVIGALISYSGVVLVCTGGTAISGGSLSTAGISLALISTVIWALYWIAKTRDPLEPVVSLFLSFLFGLPWVAAACLFLSDLRSINASGAAASVYVGLVEMGFSYVFWLMALRHASRAARISTLVFLSPFLSLVLIRYVLSEAIALTTIGGLILVVAGLLIQKLFETAARRVPNPA